MDKTRLTGESEQSKSRTFHAMRRKTEPTVKEQLNIKTLKNAFVKLIHCFENKRKLCAYLRARLTLWPLKNSKNDH